eukprot:TRINITY_DN15187_c0_g1_i1.p1 TRINITY_DN15187_c0_g1~~TRINITY_DN15187_c0_g1_i1.p1  ORF type:complete len:102 (-),score=7.35 TRINITY_DN15187_c0_g1_i1:2-307(-)
MCIRDRFYNSSISHLTSLDQSVIGRKAASHSVHPKVAIHFAQKHLHQFPLALDVIHMQHRARSQQILLLTLISVSYTHLRAHETVLDLVCRLLLEKKKTQI